MDGRQPEKLDGPDPKIQDGHLVAILKQVNYFSFSQLKNLYSDCFQNWYVDWYGWNDSWEIQYGHR